MVPSASQ